MSRDLLRNPRHRFASISASTLASTLAGVAIGGGVSQLANADSMRCGKWVVNESVTLDELVSKCGQPQSRDVTKDDIYITNTNGMRVKTGNFTVTERWIYQRSSRSLPMVVVIVDGKIVSLARASS